jgi:hypothetical protein
MPIRQGAMAVALFDLFGFKSLMRKHEHQLGALFESVNACLKMAVDSANESAQSRRR